MWTMVCVSSLKTAKPVVGIAIVLPLPLAIAVTAAIMSFATCDDDRNDDDQSIEHTLNNCPS